MYGSTRAYGQYNLLHLVVLTDLGRDHPKCKIVTAHPCSLVLHNLHNLRFQALLPHYISDTSHCWTCRHVPTARFSAVEQWVVEEKKKKKYKEEGIVPDWFM